MYNVDLFRRQLHLIPLGVNRCRRKINQYIQLCLMAIQVSDEYNNDLYRNIKNIVHRLRLHLTR